MGLCLWLYHVEVVLGLDSPQQIPDEDATVVAGREDDPGIEGVGLQDKHLRLVALRHTTPQQTVLRKLCSLHTRLSQLSPRCQTNQSINQPRSCIQIHDTMSRVLQNAYILRLYCPVLGIQKYKLSINSVRQRDIKRFPFPAICGPECKTLHLPDTFRELQ